MAGSNEAAVLFLLIVQVLSNGTDVRGAETHTALHILGRPQRL